MEAVWEWFAWLYREHGINLTVFYDAYDRRMFFHGFVTTVWISVVCIFFSVIIGVIGAWLQGSHLRITRRLVYWYIQFFRNTPPLIQLYFFYFAVGNLLPRLPNAAGTMAPPLSNFAWAVISFSFFAGAFNVEIFRAGIEAVPTATIEAAESLGYTRLQTYINVVLPLAFRISLPALNNNLVNLVKTTTLAYAIAVPELMYVSAQIWSEAANVGEMMNLLLLLYIGLIAVLIWGMDRLETKLRIPGYSV
ncbi:MAG: amino acid ABC transporter permease [Thermodesulfobacteriota bacterium]